MTNNRHRYQEPSFGNSASKPRPTNLEIDSPPRAANRPRRRRRQKSSSWFLKLIYLVLLGGLGYAGYYAYGIYMQQHISLDDLDSPSNVIPLAEEEFVEPSEDLAKNEFTLSNINWCLRQKIRLETLSGITETNSESNKVINAYQRFQNLCKLTDVNQDTLIQASEIMQEQEEQIIAQTIEDQLWLLSNLDDGNWQGNDMVLSVQKLLDQLGYEVGTPDGKLGRQTRTAIKAFQRDQGLEQTGQVNIKTLEDLETAIKLNKNNELTTIDLTN